MAAPPDLVTAANVPPRGPLTLADWRVAAARDVCKPEALTKRLADLLPALRQPADDPAWIHLATAAQLAAQTQALEARAAALPGPAEVLREMPLFGVPYAVKDNIDVAGWPTTAACPAFAYVAAASATVVRRLQAAGAVCVGKTNLDQFATGLVGTRSPYGRPACVFAADRVSGGSSSGSAVVVASGRLPFALGTDTAGSGRVPAGFNHIVGLKPTPGRVGTTGVLPACRSLDCVSVFALTVGDAAQVLAVIEGDDAGDAYSHFVPGPAQWTPLPSARPAVTAVEAASAGVSAAVPKTAAAAVVTASAAGQPRLRVGVPAAPLFGSTPGYAPAWQRAVAHLEQLGHQAVPIDFAPLHGIAELLYGGPWVAERHAVVRELLARDPAAFDPAVRCVIEAAHGFSATDAFAGQYALRAAQRVQAALWAPRSTATAAGQVDLLMVPTAPAHPSFTEVDADPLGANAQLGRYTNFVNLLGWCALALPFGFTAGHAGAAAVAAARVGTTPPAGGSAAGLPFGVTFIAPANRDAALAHFGIAWQDSLALPLGASGAPYRREAPALWPATAPTLPLVVVGAHLSGLPLNGQLIERGARFVSATRTAPHYRLYALPGTVPAKPGMQRVPGDGAAIAVEVWELPLAEVGGFLALVPPPLGLGNVELADGSWVHGFVCEAHALAEARDVTAFGGWRAFLQSLQSLAPVVAAADASPAAAAPAVPGDAADLVSDLATRSSA